MSDANQHPVGHEAINTILDPRLQRWLHNVIEVTFARLPSR